VRSPVDGEDGTTEEFAETLISGGRVFTAAEQDAWAEALVVRGDRIAARGLCR
jgi:predicted amidohydrolase YtcJ